MPKEDGDVVLKITPYILAYGYMMRSSSDGMASVPVDVDDNFKQSNSKLCTRFPLYRAYNQPDMMDVDTIYHHGALIGM